MARTHPTTRWSLSMLAALGVFVALQVIALNALDAAPAFAQDDTAVVVETLDPDPENSDGVVGFTQPAVGSQNWRARAFAQIGDTMYVAGSFLQVRGADGSLTDQPYLAAFDVDTGAWISSFRPTLDDVVWDIAATDDGRLLVGGEFDSVNGVARSGLVLLDPNGAIDTSFVTTVANPGSDFEATVRTVSIQGSTVYLAGDFNRIVDDQFAHGVFRVGRVGLGDGRIDGTWLPQVSGGGIFDLEPDPASGAVHLVGTFTSAGGAADTEGAVAVSITDGSVMPWSEFASNNLGDGSQFGVGLLDGQAWIGGSQHFLQRLDADTYERLGFYVTGAVPGTVNQRGGYVYSGPGGDFQFVAIVDGQVITGCHCHAGHHSSESLEDINVGNRPIHTYRSDGQRIDWFPNLHTWSEGPYGAGGDTNGCLWIGGDFTGNVHGFARHCPFDTTTAEIVRPFSSVIGDDQAIRFEARITDPSRASAVELRVLDADGRFLQADGRFTAGSSPLPASTTGAGSRVISAAYQLPVLPEGSYRLQVTGSGASGTDTATMVLEVAELRDLVIGTGQPADEAWDVFDEVGGRYVRGQLFDTAVFGPQGFVAVDSTTLLDHDTDLVAGDLAGIDIMWMPPTSTALYSTPELDVLEAWVSSGGVMVAYGTDFDNAAVLEHFGLPLVGVRRGGSMYADTANADHPVLNGAYGPVTLTGGYRGLRFDPADIPAGWTTLFRNAAGEPIVLAGPYGDGYVVALSTRAVLESQTGVAMLGNLMTHVADVALAPDPVVTLPPVVAPVADRTGPVSQPAEVQIFASDPDGGPVSYTAFGLPVGLSIDSATGLISGTPTTPVENRAVIVVVRDDEGDQVGVGFRWTIEAIALDAPTNVTLTSAEVGQVTVAWDPVAAASGYLIYRDDVLVASVSSDARSWVDTTVTEGESYRYELRSRAADGQVSPPSSPPAAITVAQHQDPPPVDPPTPDPPPADPPAVDDGPFIRGPEETGVDCTTAQAHPMEDVPRTSFGYDSVGCIFALGITTGTSGTTYSPDDVVTREQMAAFVERFYEMITGKECAGSHSFTDVAPTSFAFDSIGCIASLGITTGTSPTTYEPGAAVTREQMASFIARLYRLVAEQGCGSPASFGDVPASSFAYLDVGCIASLEVTTGTTPTTYSPSAAVTRIQMAAFLERLYLAFTS